MVAHVACHLVSAQQRNDWWSSNKLAVVHCNKKKQGFIIPEAEKSMKMADEARSNEEMPNRRPGEAGAHPSVAADDNELITALNPNDVLHGRGTGFNEYEGNIRFRAIVEEHKQEYIRCGKRDEKKKIATRVFDRISQSGGRFLRRTNRKLYRERVVKEGAWIEVKKEVALEKCKQALRQHHEQTSNEAAGGSDTLKSESVDPSRGQRPLGMARTMPPLEDSALPSLMSFGVLPGIGAPSDVDSRLFLSLAARLALQQQHQLLLRPSEAAPAHLQGASLPVAPSVIPLAPHAQLQNLHALSSAPGMRQSNVHDQADSSASDNVPAGENIGGVAHSQEQSSVSQADDPDNEDAVFALSALAVAGRPKFTDEQDALEQATMTDEERMAVLSDKFGKMCTVSDRQNKRPRRDLDQASIDFLVGQMKLELLRIPDDQKRALLEANASCSPDEFSDARLIQFLRCEGMNVKVRVDSPGVDMLISFSTRLS